MKKASSDPDIIASEKALRRAAQRAFEIGINSSTPVYVLKDGELVDLTKHKKSGARKSGIDTRMVQLRKFGRISTIGRNGGPGFPKMSPTAKESSISTSRLWKSCFYGTTRKR